MKKNVTVERLACVMSRDEKLETAERLASTLRHMDGLKSKHESVVAQFKEDSKKIEAEIGNLSQELRTGERFKDVHVESTVAFEANKVYFTRTDTGDVIRERELTDDERQLEMDVTADK